jgi:hypothetical protein
MNHSRLADHSVYLATALRSRARRAPCQD